MNPWPNRRGFFLSDQSRACQRPIGPNPLTVHLDSRKKRLAPETGTSRRVIARAALDGKLRRVASVSAARSSVVHSSFLRQCSHNHWDAGYSLQSRITLLSREGCFPAVTASGSASSGLTSHGPLKRRRLPPPGSSSPAASAGLHRAKRHTPLRSADLVHTLADGGCPSPDRALGRHIIIGVPTARSRVKTLQNRKNSAASQ